MELVQQDTQVKALEQIQTGIQAFAERKQSISDLVDSAKTITLSDFTDKEGLKVVTEKRKELKAARVQTEKEGKAMRDQIAPITKHILEKERELTGLITFEEDRLQTIEKWAESEKERVREEEAEAERKRVQYRVDILRGYGFELPISEISGMSDELFTTVVSSAKSQYEEEQAQKAEDDRRQKEAEDAAKRQQEADAAAIRKEKEDLAAMRKQNEDAAAELQRQKNEIEAERTRMNNEKQEADRKLQEEIDAKNRQAELKAAEDAAAERERERIAKQQEDDRLRKAEDDRKAEAAAARKLARQPDKKKIEEYISSVWAIPVPEMKTEDGKSVMSQIQELIARFESFSSQKASEL